MPTRWLQVVLGKLSTAANAPVAWLGFRTDSADMRTCGNARPSSASAVTSKWGTIFDRDLDAIEAEEAYTRTALSQNGFEPACMGSSSSRRLSGLDPTAMAGAFAIPLPELQPLVAGMPAVCTPLFNWPYPVNVPNEDEAMCSVWLVSNQDGSSKPPPSFPDKPVCPGALRQRSKCRRQQEQLGTLS